jgi:hypothetical protein
MHAFADRGCPVFVLAPGAKVPMRSCPQCDSDSTDYVSHRGIDDCPHPPDTCHGFHAATLDHDRIQDWIDRYPDLNFGISTGPAGLCVIDLDKNKRDVPIPDPYNVPGVVDGFDVFALALERYGAQYPSDAMHVSTPSGGLHLWFRLPAGVVVNKSEGAFGWLVDVRSTNSYIVGPTTMTRAGEYRRIGHATAPMAAPAWLLHHLNGTGHTPKPPEPPRPFRRRPAPAAVGTRRKTVQDLADELASAPDGERHATLVRVAMAAAYQVAEGHCDEREMRDEIHEAGRHVQRGEREIRDAIESALSRVGS